jgi:hypothetical protein
LLGAVAVVSVEWVTAAEVKAPTASRIVSYRHCTCGPTSPRVRFLFVTRLLGRFPQRGSRRRQMEVIVERCAGLDVHKDTAMVCVRTPGGDRS